MSGQLPDDELSQHWIRLVQQYRAECDAADRQRLAEELERRLEEARQGTAEGVSWEDLKQQS